MILLKLFLTFLKIGAFTFGGGYAMLPMIQEAVLENGWMNNEEILNFIAVSESTPGPFAINVSTYVGFEVAGIFGALCSTFGVVLPSFVIILLVAKFFEQFKENKIIKWIMYGLKPAVVGLIASAVITTARALANELIAGSLNNVNTGAASLLSVDIFGAVGLFILCMVLGIKKVHPIIIIVISAIVGIIVGLF